MQWHLKFEGSPRCGPVNEVRGKDSKHFNVPSTSEKGCMPMSLIESLRTAQIDPLARKLLPEVQGISEELGGVA
jgi:hypothetical protein